MSRERVNYDVQTFDLTAALNQQLIVQDGDRITGLYLRRLTVAASVQIRVGRNGRDITLRQDQGIEDRLDSGAIEAGIYMTSPASGGGIAEWLITRGPFRFISNV